MFLVQLQVVDTNGRHTQAQAVSTQAQSVSKLHYKWVLLSPQTKSKIKATKATRKYNN